MGDNSLPCGTMHIWPGLRFDSPASKPFGNVGRKGKLSRATPLSVVGVGVLVDGNRGHQTLREAGFGTTDV